MFILLTCELAYNTVSSLFRIQHMRFTLIIKKYLPSVYVFTQRFGIYS